MAVSSQAANTGGKASRARSGSVDKYATSCAQSPHTPGPGRRIAFRALAHAKDPVLVLHDLGTIPIAVLQRAYHPTAPRWTSKSPKECLDAATSHRPICSAPSGRGA